MVIPAGTHKYMKWGYLMSSNNQEMCELLSIGGRGRAFLGYIQAQTRMIKETVYLHLGAEQPGQMEQTEQRPQGMKCSCS